MAEPENSEIPIRTTQMILDAIQQVNEETHKVIKALIEGNSDNLNHALSDLSGTFAKYGEEGGLFNQLLEDLF